MVSRRRFSTSPSQPESASAPGNGKIQVLDLADELCPNGIWKRILSMKFDISDYDFDSLGRTRCTSMAVGANLRLGTHQA
jgi:hypothetical protein